MGASPDDESSLMMATALDGSDVRPSAEDAELLEDGTINRCRRDSTAEELADTIENGSGEKYGLEDLGPRIDQTEFEYVDHEPVLAHSFLTK